MARLVVLVCLLAAPAAAQQGASLLSIPDLPAPADWSQPLARGIGGAQESLRLRLRGVAAAHRAKWLERAERWMQSRQAALRISEYWLFPLYERASVEGAVAAAILGLINDRAVRELLSAREPPEIHAVGRALFHAQLHAMVSGWIRLAYGAYSRCATTARAFELVALQAWCEARTSTLGHDLSTLE